MKYTQTLKVNRVIAEQLERDCQEPPGLSDVGRDEPLFDEEVVFSNGHRMAIQVIASNEPDEESCWTQGVVFDERGNELGCTDVGESFLGEYHVPVDDDEYVVEVIAD